MTIDELRDRPEMLEAAAEMLVDGFRVNWPDAWPTIADAREEVSECLAVDRIARVAVADDGLAVGWIGAIPQYDGRVWELHPLVVLADAQGQGVGRALVLDLERCVRDRGGLVIVLGTDDENDQTSLAGVDLFPDVLGHLSSLKNVRRHPFSFYQKLGFVVSGVVPDANGFGKPDILMAKRVSRA